MFLHSWHTLLEGSGPSSSRNAKQAEPGLLRRLRVRFSICELGVLMYNTSGTQAAVNTSDQSFSQAWMLIVLCKQSIAAFHTYTYTNSSTHTEMEVMDTQNTTYGNNSEHICKLTFTGRHICELT